MPLVVRDGNGATQSLPNAGIDKTAYTIVDATVTTSFTSATDVYQFVGAAGVVARLRRMEFWSSALPSASTTFAGSSTMIKLFRRSTAGTTGTWTAITTTGKAQHSFAAAASGITVNVAGSTAFTVGTTQGELRRGFLGHSNAPAAGLNLLIAPLIWQFGNDGAYPVDVVGTADFLNVNLNTVTPVAGFHACFEWEEAST